MIKGRRNRARIVQRAEDIYTSTLTELLGTRDTLVDYEQIANQALEASIVFDREVTKQLGPEEESTHNYED